MYPRRIDVSRKEGTLAILQTLAILIVVLWLLGLDISFTMGGFVHILPAMSVAAIVSIVRLRRTPR